jgi:NADPH-dependent curcumin reductase CurA
MRSHLPSNILRIVSTRKYQLQSWETTYHTFNRLTTHSISTQKTFSSSPYFNMKEAIVYPDLKVVVHDVPTPKPNADQVLIKVVFSGSNPKDWKYPKYSGDPTKPQNSGDDIAGFVEAVGENVVEFKKGDRVAAFHQMRTPHGSFAEYAISWSHTTFHLPNKTTFEEVSFQIVIE